MKELKKTFIFLAIIISFLFAGSQQASENVYGFYGIGGYRNENALGIEECDSGGFILAGWTSDGYAHHTLIIKIDALGNLVWSKELNGYADEVYSLKKLRDGNFVVAGIGAATPKTYGLLNGFLVKFDEEGNFIWRKTFGPNAWFYDVDELANGSLIAVGGMFTADYKEYRSLIVKVDSNGNIIWHKTFRDISDDTLDRPVMLYGVKVNKLDNFFVFGKHIKGRLSSNDVERQLFMQIDNNGDVLQEKYIGEYEEVKAYGPFYEYFFVKDVLFLDNEDIVLSWNNDTIYCYSKNGEYKWGRKCPSIYENMGFLLYNFGKDKDGKHLIFAYGMNHKVSSGGFEGLIGAFEFSNNGEIKRENRFFTSSFNPRWPWPTSIPRKLGLAMSDSELAIAIRLEVATYPDDKGDDLGFFKVDPSKDASEKCAWSSLISVDWNEAERKETCNVDDLIFLPIDFVSDDLPDVVLNSGTAAGLNTFCPVIYQINKLQNPLRLEIIGDNLTPFYNSYNIVFPQVTINDVAVPLTSWKSRQKLIAKKGDALKNMIPKGVPACVKVRVVDQQGNLFRNFQSDCFYFTR